MFNMYNQKLQMKTEDRIYKIGEKMVLFPKNAIQKFQLWKQDEYQSEVYDKRFVHALLLLTTTALSLAAFDVNKETVEFIKCELLYSYNKSVIN